jgi:hypothetical protein
MKKIPKAVYETSEQLAERIRLRQLEAEQLPPGGARQSVLVEIAQLRAYADVKRWLGSAASGPRGLSRAGSRSAPDQGRLAQLGRRTPD